MLWKFQDDTPIYLQIVEQVKAKIAAGTWKAGEKLPSVRELAVEAGVNPNTMQKALAELEREGILYSQRTAGRFVSEQAKRGQMQIELARTLMRDFTDGMVKLGYSKEEICRVYKDYLSDERGKEGGKNV